MHLKVILMRKFLKVKRKTNFVTIFRKVDEQIKVVQRIYIVTTYHAKL